jgi:O-antigen/teichoic acid export membrane protein
MVTAQKITANTSFFMVALVLQKLLSFIYFTLLARTLGAEGTGQYFFAISFAAMFSVLMDVGLTPVLIREVAKDKENGQKWFQQIFTLKIITGIITVLILVITDSIVFYSDAVRNLIYLTTAIVLIDSFTLLFYGYIRGRQSLKFESWGTIIFQLIVMVMGLSLMQITNDVFVLLTVLFTASLFNLIFSGIILIKKFKVRFKLYYSQEFVKKIIAITLPFALAAIFAKVYAYMDTFLLKMFMGDAEVGFYSIAYKITFALQFIPLAFVAALYPAFSSYFKDNYEQLKKVFAKAFNYLAFIALPVSLGVIALADEIVSKLYTQEFNFSVLPLQVLIASIPFLFINFSLASFLNATNKQKINTRNLGIVMVLNVVLNIIFIPRFGIWGASLASSLSTLLLFILNLSAVMQVTSFKAKLFKPLVGSLFSALVMFGAVLYLKGIIHWVLTIIAGGIIYLLLMFITKTLKRSDIVFIKKSFGKPS